jgi:hypothetical protein
MTEAENLENLKRCPRFETCSIPKCPLDYYMQERVELPEDEICILRAKYRSKKAKGNMSATMRGIKRFVYEKNIK